MSKYGYNYRVEITHWVRSQDGDDWVDSMYWLNFNTIDEAIRAAEDPEVDRVIESRIFDMLDSKDEIWKKDWIKNKVEDYTTIPGFDYHNREYD